jgi:ribosomal protein L9
MDTSLDQIQAKIAELEARLVNLKIAERELQALGKAAAARQTKTLQAKPAIKATKPLKTAKVEEAEAAPAPVEDASAQTIGAAITAVLQQHGTLSAKAIASAVQAAGKDVNNRAISFALQAMKRSGRAKSVGGEWSLKGRTRRAA